MGNGERGMRCADNRPSDSKKLVDLDQSKWKLEYHIPVKYMYMIFNSSIQNIWIEEWNTYLLVPCGALAYLD